jgi:hypothetical protein
MKFHNSSHELGMIHKFNNTQGSKISFKYSIHEQSFIYNKFIILLTSRLLQTNTMFIGSRVGLSLPQELLDLT